MIALDLMYSVLEIRVVAIIALVLFLGGLYLLREKKVEPEGERSDCEDCEELRQTYGYPVRCGSCLFDHEDDPERWYR